MTMLKTLAAPPAAYSEPIERFCMSTGARFAGVFTSDTHQSKNRPEPILNLTSSDHSRWPRPVRDKPRQINAANMQNDDTSFSSDSNDPFSDPSPKREDYPDAATWWQAMHEQASTRLTFIKATYNKLRDDFVALENPTTEQADYYRKMEHRCRTLVGLLASHLRTIERVLRLPKKPL
jgi:hypothetical protein